MFRVVLWCFYDGSGVCVYGRKHRKILGFGGIDWCGVLFGGWENVVKILQDIFYIVNFWVFIDSMCSYAV